MHWHLPTQKASESQRDAVNPRKGALIASAARIRWHYLRTWFIPDLIVTVIDMVLELLGQKVGGPTIHRPMVQKLIPLFRL